MKVKKLYEKDNKIIFEVDGINEAEANTLRRILVSEVPIMAIEKVEFSKNDSALYDEIIAHRLGLIPLVTDLKSYELKEDPNETPKKAIEKYETTLSLSVKGPKTVLASDLIPKDPKITAVYPTMPIIKLIEDQELQLVATAQLGLAKTHAKYQGALAYYSYKPTLKINNDTKKIESFKSSYPNLAIKDNQFDEEAILVHNLYDACSGVNDELLRVDYDDTKFIFRLESFGQLNTRDLLTKALEVANEKLDEFSKALKDAKPTPMKKIRDLVTKK